METTFHMMLSDPTMLWRLSNIVYFGAGAAAGIDMRQILFSDDMDIKELVRYGRLMQGESSRAALELNQPIFWPALRLRGLPVLVLGAEKDAFLSSASVVRTALFHGAELDIMPGLAHAMMLDRRWLNAAERMERWLISQFDRH